MKTIVVLILMILTLLVRLVSSCGAPAPAPTPAPWSPTSTPTPPTPVRVPLTPTPVAFEPNYTNADTGLSLWYPDHWACEEFLEEVIFASSEEIIAGAELQSGAALMVTRSELRSHETLEDLAETTLRELSFAEVETSDHKPRSIGGQPGILITLEGRPQNADVYMKGFLAGAEHEGWGYVFVAASIEREWSEHGPILETMLDSVSFRDSEGIYTSAALGLSLRYPEGWIYEEHGDQVIFGSSDQIISGAELGTGAVLLVIRNPLEDVLTAEALLEMMLSEMPFGGMEMSDMEPRTVGGERGAMVTFEGIPQGEDVRLAGFLVAADHGDCGYLFLAISAVDEWCNYGPVLETTLDSVQFTE
jgi:hypothetical protein